LKRNASAKLTGAKNIIMLRSTSKETSVASRFTNSKKKIGWLISIRWYISKMIKAMKTTTANSSIH